MDFALTEEQELLLESVDELMERYGTEQYFKECDEKHEWPTEFTDALLENGFQLIFGAGAKDMTCFCGEARPAGARLSVRWGIRAVCQILVSGGSWTECVACWPLFVERGGAGRLRGDGKCDRMRKRVGRCTI